jgi:hypothetical protein
MPRVWTLGRGASGTVVSLTTDGPPWPSRGPCIPGPRRRPPPPRGAPSFGSAHLCFPRRRCTGSIRGEVGGGRLLASQECSEWISGGSDRTQERRVVACSYFADVVAWILGAAPARARAANPAAADHAVRRGRHGEPRCLPAPPSSACPVVVHLQRGVQQWPPAQPLSSSGEGASRGRLRMRQ